MSLDFSLLILRQSTNCLFRDFDHKKYTGGNNDCHIKILIEKSIIIPPSRKKSFIFKESFHED